MASGKTASKCLLAMLGVRCFGNSVSCLLVRCVTVAVMLPDLDDAVGANRARKDTNAQNFVTNHFVLRNVNSLYGVVSANRKPSA
jgi:hypothetical protein